MAEVRVFNPARPLLINPRRAKPWTEKQAAARKDQAENFVRDVLEDDDRADEISGMSVADYAAERGKELVSNPRRRNNKMRRKGISRAVTDDDGSLQTNAKLAVANNKLADQQKDLLDRIDSLQAKNKELQSKLDEIDDVVNCNDPECNAEEHVADVQDIL